MWKVIKCGFIFSSGLMAGVGLCLCGVLKFISTDESVKKAAATAAVDIVSEAVKSRIEKQDNKKESKGATYYYVCND